MPGFDIDLNGSVLYANNVDFTGTSATSGSSQMLANGQLLIGAASAPRIRVNTLTSGSGISITNGPGSITIGVNGSTVGQTITADTGGPISPSSGNWNLLAGTNTNTSGSGSTLRVNLNTQVLQPNGTAAAPPYSFTNSTNSGMYLAAGPQLKIAASGVDYMIIDPVAQVNTVKSDGQLRLNASAYIKVQSFLQFENGIQYAYNAPVSWPYTAATSDYYISVDSSSARTVNLPNSSSTGQMYIVKDRVGSAGSNNITITTPGGTVTFDGSTSYKITSNYGSATFVFNGTNYEVI